MSANKPSAPSPASVDLPCGSQLPTSHSLGHPVSSGPGQGGGGTGGLFRAGHRCPQSSGAPASSRSCCIQDGPGLCWGHGPQVGRGAQPPRPAAHTCGQNRVSTESLSSHQAPAPITASRDCVSPPHPTPPAPGALGGTERLGHGDVGGRWGTHDRVGPHVDLWFFMSSWMSSPRGLTVKMRDSGSPTCR